LPARTARRTVPHMLGRHRTAPDRDLTTAAAAIHQRLSGAIVTARSDPPRLDRRTLRARLGGPSGGLRDRLERGLTPG
jgi:hypothetical protein